MTKLLDFKPKELAIELTEGDAFSFNVRVSLVDPETGVKTPQSLAGTTMSLIIMDRQTGAPIRTLVASVLDEAGGLATISFTTDDTSVGVGRYKHAIVLRGAVSRTLYHGQLSIEAVA